MKADNQVSIGLLQSLSIMEWKRDMITMDFVTGLSMRDPKDAIRAIVDRFTKSAHFLAINKMDNIVVLAKLYVEHIVRLHGVPVSIV